MTEVEAFASGKHIGLFGSYGWGDGEWMRDWQARMANAGAHVVGGEGVIARESPDEDALNQCRELGEAWQTFRFAFFWCYGIMMEWCHDFIKAAGGYKTYGKRRRQRQD